MKEVTISPLWETTINRAVFVNQDLTIYPDRKKGLPDNFTNVVKFLFGEGAYVRVDTVNGYPSFVIKGATFELNKVKTINADWTYQEVKQ